MAKIRYRRGVNAQSVYVFLPDSASTTGAGKTGVTFDAVTVYYAAYRSTPQPADPTSSIAANAGYTPLGWSEIDATNMPGVYRYDPPADTVFSAGQTGLLTFTAAGIVPTTCEFQLDDMSEPSNIPASNVSMETKINTIYAFCRNRLTQTASQQQLLADDDTTPIGTSTTSDAGGTFTRGKFTSS